MGKELEVGPEDLATLLRNGAIKFKGNVISLTDDDPDDLEAWADVKKAVDERIAEINEIEKEDEDEGEADDEETEDEDEDLDEDESDKDETPEEDPENPEPDPGEEK
jgi:hypothetical protein